MKNQTLPAEQEAAVRRLVADCLKREGFHLGDPAQLFLDSSEGDSLVVASLEVRLVSRNQWHEIPSSPPAPVNEPPPLVFTAPVRMLRRQNPLLPMEDQVFGGLVLHNQLHRVDVDGVPVPLTLREYQLLSYLCFHKNLVLTRSQIIAAVWDIGYRGDDRTVDTHIKCLRAKLGPYSRHIQTLRKVGYRFSWEENP